MPAFAPVVNRYSALTTRSARYALLRSCGALALASVNTITFGVVPRVSSSFAPPSIGVTDSTADHSGAGANQSVIGPADSARAALRDRATATSTAKPRKAWVNDFI